MEGEAQHYCINSMACPPQIKGKIAHFASRKAMDIEGLGQETIDLLFEAGLVRNLTDIYKLQKEDLLQLDRWADRSAQNLLDGIQGSKQQPFERVLYALGIRYVGETVAKRLARGYPSIHSLRSATLENLIELDDIGERIAQSVVAFFKQPDQLHQILELEKFGLKMESVAQESLQNGPLSGLTFVVSGVFQEYSRDGIKKAVEEAGGRVVGSISGSVNYLLAGDKMGPAKRVKAEKLGIQIVDESQFISMLGK
jgi:DNA ligase (NAD+)